MKLVYITASLPYGPGEAFFLPEIEEMRRLGHEVVLVPAFGRGPVVHASAVNWPCWDRRLISATMLRSALAEALCSPLRTFRVAARLLRSRNLRIMAKNCAILPKALWLSAQLRRFRADHVHACWSSVAATLAWIAADLAGIPWSFTAHRWDIVENNLLADKARRALAARFISNASLQLFPMQSQDGEQRVLHLGIRLPALPAASRRQTRVPVVLCPAGLLPVKGHRYLIDAHALLLRRGLGLELWLAGEGPLRSALQAQVEELEMLPHVRFLGQLDHHHLLGMYANHQVDLVVLPSLDLGRSLHEAIPVSLMEAMSYSIPVIGTMAGGTPELLGEGAGVLVPPGDSAALAGAIELLVRDPELRERFAAAGRKRVEEEFDVRRTVSEFLRHLAPVHRCLAVCPCSAQPRPVLPDENT